MPPIEPLESRRLFSQFGLDRSFGNNGAVAVAAARDDADLVTRRDISAVLDTGSAVYVAVATDGDSAFNDFTPGYVARYTEAGAVDTAWGDGGVAELPFTATKLAVDRRTGKLYAAGSQAVDRDDAELDFGQFPESLRVARLTNDGTLDAAYGAAGLIAYQPAAPPGHAAAQAAPAHLIVRPHGVLDVGLTIVAVDDARYTAAVSVVRLKNNGNRDAAFGRRGVASLSAYDRYALPVLTPAADGGLEAVVTNTALPNALVRRLAIDDAGHIDAGPTMQGPETDTEEGSTYFGGPGSVVADADHVYATDADGRTLYTLTPGRATVARPLVVPGLSRGEGSYDGITLMAAPRGGFYALNNFEGDSPYQGVAVARLRADFSLDRRFGTNGLVATGAFDPPRVFPDADGRFLAADPQLGAPPVLTRLLGRGGEGPVTSVRAGDSRMAGDVVRVAGTAGDDTVSVRFDEPTDTFVVAVNGKPAKTYRARFGPSLLIDTGRGDDAITIDGVQAKTIVLAGRGNDTVRVSNASGIVGRDSGFALRGGFGRDVFRVSASSGLQIDGGRDKDRLTIDAYSSEYYTTVIEAIEQREDI